MAVVIQVSGLPRVNGTGSLTFSPAENMKMFHIFIKLKVGNKADLLKGGKLGWIGLGSYLEGL